MRKTKNMTEATTKFKRYLYLRDGQEMVAINAQESVNLNTALYKGLITQDEVTAIRQAQKDQHDADDL